MHDVDRALAYRWQLVLPATGDGQLSLSRPFGAETIGRPEQNAATNMLHVPNPLTPSASGSLCSHNGVELPR